MIEASLHEKGQQTDGPFLQIQHAWSVGLLLTVLLLLVDWISHENPLTRN